MRRSDLAEVPAHDEMNVSGLIQHQPSNALVANSPVSVPATTASITCPSPCGLSGDSGKLSPALLSCPSSS